MRGFTKDSVSLRLTALLAFLCVLATAISASLQGSSALAANVKASAAVSQTDAAKTKAAPASRVAPAAVNMHVLQKPISFHDATRPLPPPPAIAAAAGILVDADTHEILWQQNAHQALPPASTTKIMTALVTLENFSPDQVITITDSALHQDPDETVMGLVAGEKLTVRELLSGMLLVSGNDAATAIAVDTVGWDRFVATMNQQEAALGLHDSHFATTVGLDTPGHAISAYDLAAIGITAEDNFPTFAQIVRSKEITIPQTGQHHAYDLVNINELLALDPNAVGLKPGYTDAAGPCIVGMAVSGGHRVVAVLLNAQGYDGNFHQGQTLLDWGLAAEGQ